MAWGESQALVNDAVMQTFGVTVEVVDGPHRFMGVLDRPYDEELHGGVQSELADSWLLVYDGDAALVDNGTRLIVDGVEFPSTIVDKQGDKDGLTRLALREYAL